MPDYFNQSHFAIGQAYNRRDKMPDYFNQSHFAIGQAVTYSGFPGTITRHYYEGMWEVRLPGGLVCVSGADIIPA